MPGMMDTVLNLGLNEETVKVSISDEAKDLIALLHGEKLPVEQIKEQPPITDYSKKLKNKRRTNKKNDNF